MLIVAIIAVILLCLLIPALVAGHSLAPWLASYDEDVETALDLALARPGEVFYDLGCGEGHALFVAARRGLWAVGIELSPILFFIAKARSIFFTEKLEKGRVRVILGDLFKKDISNADIIFVYGLPSALRGRFAKKLQQDAQPGTKVVSCHFPIESWQEKAVGYSPQRKTPLYLYEISEKQK